MMKAVCFSGHREEPSGIINRFLFKRRLKQAVKAAIRQRYTHYISGMARGFDLMAAETVLKLKKTHPYLTLEGAVPCPNQTKGWEKANIRLYEKILKKCDKKTIITPEYVDGCMLLRNRYMVDQSSLLIAAYDGRTAGGTAYTISYAQKKKIKVILLPYFTQKKKHR